MSTLIPERARRLLAAGLLGSALFFGHGPVVSAVPPPSTTPEEVAAAAFAHMQAGDWEASAELFDPAELKRFRDMMQTVLDSGAKSPDASSSGAADPTLEAFFGPGVSIESLRAMSDSRFMASVMSAMIGKTGVDLREQRLFGHVAESDDTVHVVARTILSMNGVTVSKVDVVTLRRTAEGWRLALKGEMTGLAEALSAARERGRAGQAPAGEADH